MTEKQIMTDVLIVGAGTAGLTAAVYAARAGKSVKLVEQYLQGGQIINIASVAAFQPILMEALPLTLEEIFIYELGGEDYAVRDIVL